MLRKIIFGFTALLLASSLLPVKESMAQSLSENANPKVSVAQGMVEGVHDSGLNIFKGIPFAQPPVDELRWREPQKAKQWNDVYKADQFSAACMQLPIYDDMNFRSDGISEDCLYLNIWTPAKKADRQLPVLLYFYGGGFMAGDGSEPRYDGASMARNHGLITVTTNYRLGVFGFLAHPELTEESPHQASGNYGLLDQAMAIKWVKENIAAFGGDPDNITIAGESAGSISVSAQMASPLSRDHIAGAIGESGSIMGTLSATPLEENENNGLKFAETINASSLKELRSIPADQLLQATGQSSSPRFTPTLDGYFFPRSPEEIYAAGEQADVPLFVGWNSKEMNYRFIMRDTKPTPENYKKRLREIFGSQADRALELYPASTTEEAIYSATDLAGDQFIGYSTWKWSTLHSETAGSPVYRYYYTHPRPPQKDEFSDSDSNATEKSLTEAPNALPEPDGAVHAAEIEYLMGNLPYNEVYSWTPVDYKISDIFQKYAARFVQNKDPNAIGLPYWKAINDSGQPKVLHIGSTTELQDEQHRERYLFLDQLK